MCLSFMCTSMWAVSLAQLTGETYSLSRAYERVVLGREDGAMGAPYSYSVCVRWMREQGARVGIVYDGSASVNVAILHADVSNYVRQDSSIDGVRALRRIVDESECDECRDGVEWTKRWLDSMEREVRDTMVMASVSTVRVGVLSVGVSMVSMVPAMVSEMASIPSRGWTVVADCGYSKRVNMRELYDVMMERGSHDDERAMRWAWWSFIRKHGGSVHPSVFMMQCGGGCDDVERALRAVDDMSEMRAWHWLSCRLWAYEACCAMMDDVSVLPEYSAGGSAGVAMGTGLHKVNAAKSRRACKKQGGRS